MDVKVILTNHTMRAGKVVSLHEGRGSREKVFGELKSPVQPRYLPCGRLHANQTWAALPIRLWSRHSQVDKSSLT